jgi:hypothetical protein
VSYKRHELLKLREHLGSPPDFGGVRGSPLGFAGVRGSPPDFGGVRVAHPFSYLSSICFICLHSVSCAPNVDSVTELSILHCPFGFL